MEKLQYNKGHVSLVPVHLRRAVSTVHHMLLNLTLPPRPVLILRRYRYPDRPELPGNPYRRKPFNMLRVHWSRRLQIVLIKDISAYHSVVLRTCRNSIPGNNITYGRRTVEYEIGFRLS